MRAHIWLGLLAVPLLLFHAGPTWGGMLSTTVMVVFLLTILSGVWGLWLQQRLPARMYSEVPGETIASQIPFVMAQYLREAQELVEARCEPAVPTIADVGLDSVAPSSAFMTLAELDSSPGNPRVIADRPPIEEAIPGTRPIRLFFDQQIETYLRDGASGGSILANPAQAEHRFREVEAVVPIDSLFVVRKLENHCNLRRQFDRQENLHFWLHQWICIHLPLTAALLILMVVHIWVALRYW